MKSCLIVLLVVVYVAAAVAEGEKCFKDGELEKMWKEKMEKKNAPLVKKCKEDKPETASDESKVNECVKGKWAAAMKECKAKDDSDTNTTREQRIEGWKCVNKKLGIEYKNEVVIIADYKTKMLGIALPDKKKIVEDAIKPCEEKKGHEARKCAKENMSKVCSDFKCRKGRKGGKGKNEKKD